MSKTVCVFCDRPIPAGAKMFLRYHANDPICAECATTCKVCKARTEPSVVAWQGVNLCKTHYAEWVEANRPKVKPLKEPSR